MLFTTLHSWTLNSVIATDMNGYCKCNCVFLQDLSVITQGQILKGEGVSWSMTYKAPDSSKLYSLLVLLFICDIPGLAFCGMMSFSNIWMKSWPPSWPWGILTVPSFQGKSSPIHPKKGWGREWTNLENPF